MFKKLIGDTPYSKISFVRYILFIISSILLFIFFKKLVPYTNAVVSFIMLMYSIFGLLELFSLKSHKEEQYKFFLQSSYFNFIYYTNIVKHKR